MRAVIVFFVLALAANLCSAQWYQQNSGTSVQLNGVAFADAGNGYVVGDSGIILHTANGGTTWTRQSSGTVSNLNGICFIDASTGWAVGSSGTILHTTNGGIAFAEQPRITQVPSDFSLQQNFPNPFNPSSTIRYGLPQTSFVMLTVYNTLGQQVAQLVNEQQQAGYHDVVFRGDGLASGVYFCRMQVGDFVDAKKFVLMK